MEKTSQKTLRTILFGVVGINLILSIVALVSQTSFQNLLIQKEGDRTLLSQIVNHPKYKEEMKKSLEGVLKTLENPNANLPQQNQPQAQGQEEQTPSGKLTQAEMKSILNDVYVKGTKNAQISIIEYSDMECPFCKRHHGAGVVEKLLTNFGNDVNYVYKHFPLSFHPTAQKAAEGAECVAQIGGEKLFYEYIDQVFDGTSDLDAIKKIATNLKINVATFDKCLTDGTHADKVKANMAEGAKLFGVNGTPGTVILDNESGEWVLISGAYPYEAFEAEIKKFLAK